jgi:hypothetical protein
VPTVATQVVPTVATQVVPTVATQVVPTAPTAPTVPTAVTPVTAATFVPVTLGPPATFVPVTLGPPVTLVPVTAVTLAPPATAVTQPPPPTVVTQAPPGTVVTQPPPTNTSAVSTPGGTAPTPGGEPGTPGPPGTPGTGISGTTTPGEGQPGTGIPGTGAPGTPGTGVGDGGGDGDGDGSGDDDDGDGDGPEPTPVEEIPTPVETIVVTETPADTPEPTPTPTPIPCCEDASAQCLLPGGVNLAWDGVCGDSEIIWRLEGGSWKPNFVSAGASENIIVYKVNWKSPEDLGDLTDEEFNFCCGFQKSGDPLTAEQEIEAEYYGGKWDVTQYNPGSGEACDYMSVELNTAMYLALGFDEEGNRKEGNAGAIDARKMFQHDYSENLIPNPNDSQSTNKFYDEAIYNARITKLFSGGDFGKCVDAESEYVQLSSLTNIKVSTISLGPTGFNANIGENTLNIGRCGFKNPAPEAGDDGCEAKGEAQIVKIKQRKQIKEVSFCGNTSLWASCEVFRDVWVPDCLYNYYVGEDCTYIKEEVDPFTIETQLEDELSFQYGGGRGKKKPKEYTSDYTADIKIELCTGNLNLEIKFGKKLPRQNLNLPFTLDSNIFGVDNTTKTISAIFATQEDENGNSISFQNGALYTAVVQDGENLEGWPKDEFPNTGSGCRLEIAYCVTVVSKDVNSNPFLGTGTFFNIIQQIQYAIEADDPCAKKIQEDINKKLEGGDIASLFKRFPFVTANNIINVLGGYNGNGFDQITNFQELDDYLQEVQTFVNLFYVDVFVSKMQQARREIIEREDLNAGETSVTDIFNNYLNNSEDPYFNNFWDDIYNALSETAPENFLLTSPAIPDLREGTPDDNIGKANSDYRFSYVASISMLNFEGLAELLDLGLGDNRPVPITLEAVCPKTLNSEYWYLPDSNSEFQDGYDWEYQQSTPFGRIVAAHDFISSISLIIGCLCGQAAKISGVLKFHETIDLNAEWLKLIDSTGYSLEDLSGLCSLTSIPLSHIHYPIESGKSEPEEGTEPENCLQISIEGFDPNKDFKIEAPVSKPKYGTKDPVTIKVKIANIVGD